MNHVSEEERQEQLDVVLQLNKLTKRGDLSWTRVPRHDVGLSGVTYVADWKTYQIIVEESSVGSSAGLDIAGTHSSSYRVRIRARNADEEEEDLIVIPPMPAIDDLVSTIQRVNDEFDRAKGDLDKLRSFKKRLEEEL